MTAQRFISKDSSPVAKKKAFDGREDLDLVDKVLLEPVSRINSIYSPLYVWGMAIWYGVSCATSLQRK